MKPSPAFQFYPQDFLVGCAELTAEQVGAYIRLLCYQWSKGALPDNDKLLAALGGCRVASVAVLRLKFHKGQDGLLRNDRLEEVREEQNSYRQKQATRAADGWHSRRNATSGNAPAMPRHSAGNADAMPSAASVRQCSSPSPSSSNKDTEPPSGGNGSVPKPRNLLFDALAALDGSDPGGLTKSAARACGVALAEIRAATPEVTPDEIRRRGANYKRQFRDAHITPSALAKWWARCASAPQEIGEPARVGVNL